MKGKIGIIGGGNMGSALVGGLLRSGHRKSQIFLSDHRAANCQRMRKQWGISTTTDNGDLVAKVDIVLLAVKPQSMREVVTSLSPSLRKKTLIISIAAGITTEQIQKWLGHKAPIIRAMPNTPAQMGLSATGLFATKAVKPQQKKQGEQLLEAVGETAWIKKEALMDVVTALSGSGPAYFFYVMESLIAGATELGLPRDIANKLTLQTALGSAAMAFHSAQAIGQLRKNVTSKGGTTEQGIKALKNGKLENLFKKTLSAATKRGKTLSKQFD